MTSLRNLPLVRAVRDLRSYLLTRKRYEIWFLMAAIVVTFVMILALFVDSSDHREYRRNIVYVQQWSANRTDAEIVAQQAIDGPKERAAKEQAAREDEERRQQFERLDNTLSSWGI